MKKKRIFISMMAGMGRVNRCLPIALKLREMGHEVAYTIWGNAGAAMEKIGFEAIPIPPIPEPRGQSFDPNFTNFHHFLSMMGYSDREYMRNELESRLGVTSGFKPDLVLTDSSLSAAFIARKLGIPLVSIHQSCSLPGGLPFTLDIANAEKKQYEHEHEVTGALNEVLALHRLDQASSALSFLAGDLALVPSIPEFDPVDPKALSIPLEYVGPIVWRDDSFAGMPPSWITPQQTGTRNRRVFVYTSRLIEWGVESGGHIFKEVIHALGNTSTEVLIATGFNPLEGEESEIPPNVAFTTYVSGVMAAEQSDIMIHHGGHGSCMTTLLTGTPSLVIPTWAEREFNARQLEAVGGGRMICPSDMSGQQLAEIVASMLNDGALEDARQLQQSIAAKNYGGAERAVALISRLL